MKHLCLVALAFCFLIGVGGGPARADGQGDTRVLRWFGSGLSMSSDLDAVLAEVNQATSFTLTSTDFRAIEELPLAHFGFKMYVQLRAGVPMQDRSIRVWTLGSSGLPVQIEAQVDAPGVTKAAKKKLANQVEVDDRAVAALEIARDSREDVAAHPAQVTGATVWVGQELVRVIRAVGRRGVHEITVNLETGAVIAHRFRPHPTADDGGFSLKARVYPIYEESYTGAPGAQLERQDVELRNLNREVSRGTTDPYEKLRERKYTEFKYDPVLGETPEGQAQGFWSMAWVKREARKLREELPLSANDFDGGGVFLEGRYATVNLHPAAGQAFGSQLGFEPSFSPQFYPTWKESEDEAGESYWEMVPTGALRGRPLQAADEAYQRPARRDANHDPVKYIQDGFDEIQVYYAIQRLFDSLGGMGFKDPELSSRPFNAFLYDPDIGMRDNAYYYEDTINFTTYSPDQPNFARDNATIWHELGHGVMDRLMGTWIRLADSGGLSEGMADFVAQMVIEDVTDHVPFAGSDSFRIINRMGFLLSNEEHDDGEAYGGAMYDLLLAARENFGGKAGVYKVADLTLDAMRLARNHPALTATDWFTRMLDADTLGDEIREPGELRDLVLTALAGRNFNLNGDAPARFDVRYASEAAGSESGDDAQSPAAEWTDLTNESVGSRYNPYRVELADNESKGFKLRLSVADGAKYAFQYPVTVRLSFQGGPLQGAVHWEQEDGGEGAHVDLTLADPSQAVEMDVAALGKCDFVNREDGSCSDFVYLQVFGAGEVEKGYPRAKKRFYVRVKPKSG